MSAHDAEPVRVIHEQARAVTFLQLADLGQPCQVALHSEHALGDDEDAALSVLLRGLQVRFQVPHVVVLERPEAPPGRGQDGGVDHRGMGKGVDDHHVIGTHQGRDRPQHTEVAVIENNGRRLSTERRETPLQLDMRLGVAREQA